jgi:hypothetical protein
VRLCRNSQNHSQAANKFTTASVEVRVQVQVLTIGTGELFESPDCSWRGHCAFNIRCKRERNSVTNPVNIRTIYQPRELSVHPGTPFRQACQRAKPCRHCLKPTFASVTNPSGVTLPKQQNPCKHWFVTLARLYIRSEGGRKASRTFRFLSASVGLPSKGSAAAGERDQG